MAVCSTAGVYKPGREEEKQAVERHLQRELLLQIGKVLFEGGIYSVEITKEEKPAYPGYFEDREREIRYTAHMEKARVREIRAYIPEPQPPQPIKKPKRRLWDRIRGWLFGE